MLSEVFGSPKWIFMFAAIILWLANLYIFLIWIILLFRIKKSKNKLPQSILIRIDGKEKQLEKRRNHLKLMALIGTAVYVLFGGRLLLSYYGNKEVFYEIAFPFAVYLVPPGPIFLLLIFLFQNTYYKLSKRFSDAEK